MIPHTFTHRPSEKKIHLNRRPSVRRLKSGRACLDTFPYPKSGILSASILTFFAALHLTLPPAAPLPPGAHAGFGPGYIQICSGQAVPSCIHVSALAVLAEGGGGGGGGKEQGEGEKGEAGVAPLVKTYPHRKLETHQTISNHNTREPENLKNNSPWNHSTRHYNPCNRPQVDINRRG